MTLNFIIIAGAFAPAVPAIYFLEELSDKEEDFIDRAVNPRLNSRLGCQCVLLDGDGEIEVTLPDQTQFLGE
jgi:2Fe-2S ferredoxin